MSDEQGVMINAAERAYIERLRSALEKCEGALRKARDDFAMHTREIATVVNQCAMSEKAVIELKVLMVQCDEAKDKTVSALAAAEEARGK